MSLLSWLNKKFGAELPENNPQQWLIQAVQNCVDGLWALQGRRLFISPQLKMLLGYQGDDEALDQISWWSDQIHPDDIRHARYFFLRCLKQELTIDSCEFRIRHQNSRWTWCLIKCQPHQLSKGKIPYLVGTVNDITSYRLLHNQLERTIEEAERISQAKSNFISSFNHELRTPLVGILGNIHLLEETPLSNEQKDYTQNIATSAELLLNLINDVLDISKISVGKLELDQSEFTLKTLTNSTLGIFKHLINKKNLILECRIDDNIPLNVIGDRLRIQQVLINLLNNAIKFTSQGSIKLLINLARLDGKQAEVLFQIIDTGTGISKDELPRLFQDFTQANAHISTTHGGTGLGLSICKKLVGLMDGDIGVQSSLGKGSTFWFKIPLTISPDQNLKSQESPSPVKICSLKILVADDNIINQQVLSGLLKKDHHEVTIASNGQEAVDLVKQHNFNVILMDINMPILGGIDATKLIRALPQGKDKLIYAATADTSAFECKDVTALGFNGILSKPINITDFYDKLNQQQAIKVISEETPIQVNPADIDQKYIQGLISDLGKETVVNLLTLYSAEASEIVAKLHKSQPQESYDLAHTLAGISENLGFKKIGQVSRQLMDIKGDNDTAYQQQIKSLDQCLKDHHPEINALVNTLSSTD